MKPRLARYEVLGRLASGGMAQVWLARAVGPGGFEKRVVLKTILPQFASSEQFTKMFIDEARVAAMLNHPNCVSIFDLGDESGTLFIAMEYIEGFSLSRILKRAEAGGGRVPQPILARICMDAASGLDYAHRLADNDGKPMGLIHRDISPDNLLVSLTGQTKVVDFGIAKAVSEKPGGTRTGTVKGKFGYMAPEYLRGDPTDSRADLFALGVVLYRGLTGRKPFVGPTEAMVSKAVLDFEPDRPSVVAPEVGPELEAVTLRALVKNPNVRFESGRAMRAAIEAAAGKVADADGVAAWLESLWPPGDPERKALDDLAHGRSTDNSSPALESVVSEEVDLGTLSIATPHTASRVPITGVTGSTGATGATGVRPRRSPVLAVIAVGVLAAVAFVGWRELRPKTSEVKPAPAVTEPPPPRAPSDPAPAQEPEEAAPPPTVEAAAAPAPVPAPLPAGEKKRGRIEVAVSPPVSVSFKGKLLGKAPGTFDVPAGSGPLKLFDKASGLEKTLSLRVAGGQTERVKVEFGKAKLEVRVSPWANVKLDGKALGQTPIPPVEVWEGVHVLELENPDLGQKKRLEVKLHAGEARTVRESL